VIDEREALADDGWVLTGRNCFRALFALAVLATLCVVPGASASAFYPLFTIEADHHLLGEVNDLTFNLEYLSSAGEAEKATIQTPAGFNASLVQAVGTNLGAAGLGVLRAGTNVSASPTAAVTRYAGSVMVMDPNAFANDPNAQACAPGPHTATWALTLRSADARNVQSVSGGQIKIPVAVDTSHGGYKLTMCFDALKAAGMEVEYLYLTPNQVFRNPGRHGNFLFDGVITPYQTTTSTTATDGTTTPDEATSATNAPPSYELRAYEVLPQLLTATPTYSQTNQQLTVTGKFQVDGKARKYTWVHVYAGNDKALSWVDLGTAVTRQDGSYTFTTRLPKLQYSYLYTKVTGSSQATCPGTSSQPAGCASTSSDGRSSLLAKIAVRP
jgi:hypothetical protein